MLSDIQDLNISTVVIQEKLGRMLKSERTSSDLRSEKNGYLFLKINDKFVQSLFPLLDSPKKRMTDCFEPNGIGAHISVVYEWEITAPIALEVPNMEIDFKIVKMFVVDLPPKRYFAAEIESIPLQEIRKSLGLDPHFLNFKGHFFPFHFTIGEEDIE